MREALSNIVIQEIKKKHQPFHLTLSRKQLRIIETLIKNMQSECANYAKPTPLLSDLEDQKNIDEKSLAVIQNLIKNGRRIIRVLQNTPSPQQSEDPQTPAQTQYNQQADKKTLTEYPVPDQKNAKTVNTTFLPRFLNGIDIIPLDDTQKALESFELLLNVLENEVWDYKNGLTKPEETLSGFVCYLQQLLSIVNRIISRTYYLKRPPTHPAVLISDTESGIPLQIDVSEKLKVPA